MYRVDTELLPCWTMQTESKYMKCKDSIVGEVKASLKPKADYQLSAISTYKPKKSCPQSSQDDLVTERSFLIDSFKRKGSVFIQMQTNCSKLKEVHDILESQKLQKDQSDLKLKLQNTETNQSLKFQGILGGQSDFDRTKLENQEI